MKIHRVTLLVVDHAELGAGAVTEALEETRYPNDCISPSVIDVVTAEVDWHDDHPINRRGTMRAEFERLFAKGGRI